MTINIVVKDRIIEREPSVLVDSLIIVGVKGISSFTVLVLDVVFISIKENFFFSFIRKIS